MTDSHVHTAETCPICGGEGACESATLNSGKADSARLREQGLIELERLIVNEIDNGCGMYREGLRIALSLLHRVSAMESKTMATHLPKCANCGESAAHYVMPFNGAPGYYTCSNAEDCPTCSGRGWSCVVDGDRIECDNCKGTGSVISPASGGGKGE